MRKPYTAIKGALSLSKSHLIKHLCLDKTRPQVQNCSGPSVSPDSPTLPDRERLNLMGDDKFSSSRECLSRSVTKEVHFFLEVLRRIFCSIYGSLLTTRRPKYVNSPKTENSFRVTLTHTLLWSRIRLPSKRNQYFTPYSLPRSYYP